MADLRVQIVKYELVNVNGTQHATYLIKVVGPRDISFHIKDRYSSLRDFQDMIKRNIDSKDGTPSFPKKKFFNNLDEAFLEQRSQQLSLFLNTFLAHPLVKTCDLVPIYFKGKALDEDSKNSINDLISLMSG